ncbi:MAG: Transposase domain protein [Gemmataceae bacterium]|nr:Transposase domain protein [Gemmataceae bacterium]
MGGARPDPLPGYRVKILGGNHLARPQRRLKPLRDVAAGPLPRQTSVVLDPALGLAVDVVCGPDGHAQERSLLDPLLATVAARAVRIEDRNFCTTAFVFGVADRGGSFVVRRHASTLTWARESDWQPAGRTATGSLTEQTIWLVGPDEVEMPVRRVLLALDHPTQDGETEIEILTNRPAAFDATAPTVAELYRRQWSIEGLFQRLTTALKGDVNTLGYPPAALFGFCVALASSNVSAAVTGAVRAAHPTAAPVSEYHIGLEIAGTMPGLEVAVPAEMWAGLHGWSADRMAGWLLGLAGGRTRLGIGRGHAGRRNRSPGGPGLPTRSTSRPLDS